MIDAVDAGPGTRSGSGPSRIRGLAVAVMAVEAITFLIFASLHVGFQIPLDIGCDLLSLSREFEQRIEIVGEGPDAVVVGDRLFEPFAVLHDLLALLGLGPEVRRGDLLFRFA